MPAARSYLEGSTAAVPCASAATPGSKAQLCSPMMHGDEGQLRASCSASASGGAARRPDRHIDADTAATRRSLPVSPPAAASGPAVSTAAPRLAEGVSALWVERVVNTGDPGHNVQLACLLGVHDHGADVWSCAVRPFDLSADEAVLRNATDSKCVLKKGAWKGCGKPRRHQEVGAHKTLRIKKQVVEGGEWCFLVKVRNGPVTKVLHAQTLWLSGDEVKVLSPPRACESFDLPRRGQENPPKQRVLRDGVSPPVVVPLVVGPRHQLASLAQTDELIDTRPEALRGKKRKLAAACATAAVAETALNRCPPPPSSQHPPSRHTVTTAAKVSARRLDGPGALFCCGNCRQKVRVQKELRAVEVQLVESVKKQQQRRQEMAQLDTEIAQADENARAAQAQQQRDRALVEEMHASGPRRTLVCKTQ